MNSTSLQSPRVAARTVAPRRTTRLATGTAITAALLVLLLLPTMARAGDSSGDDRKPTIVLVHGAWAGPGCWDQVVKELRQDGYRTATPTLEMLTIDGDVATVRKTLDGIPGKKILVGHSYGGVVISDAAAGRSDVLGLVYSAAFVPDQGDTIQSLGTGFIPSEAFAHLVFTGAPFASPAYIDQAYFPQYFAQDLPAKQAAVLDAAQRPLNFPILGTPSGPVAWHTLPSWYAVSGADRTIDPNEERSMAKRAGATVIEIPTASHVGGITAHAERFTKLIEQAVRATTGHDGGRDDR